MDKVQEILDRIEANEYASANGDALFQLDMRELQSDIQEMKETMRSLKEELKMFTSNTGL